MRCGSSSSSHSGFYLIAHAHSARPSVKVDCVWLIVVGVRRATRWVECFRSRGFFHSMLSGIAHIYNVTLRRTKIRNNNLSMRSEQPRQPGRLPTGRCYDNPGGPRYGAPRCAGATGIAKGCESGAGPRPGPGAAAEHAGGPSPGNPPPQPNGGRGEGSRGRV